jgi:hypothetical protein
MSNSDTKVGSIVFGPKLDQTDRQHWRNLLGGYSVGAKVSNAQPCNCIGPQPGETKCPCALAGEAAMGRKMIEEGVTINGVRYRLVPEAAKTEVAL